MAAQYSKPLVKPIRTPYGFYVYETNQNKLLSVQEPLFRLIEAVLADDTAAIQQADPTAAAQYQELQELGYLSCHRVEQLEHPSTNLLPYYLERKIDRMTLQVTQQCNLRCSYCVYSEQINSSHRSHSSKKLSLEMGKQAIDFYYQHSLDCPRIFLSFYGGEPLLEFDLIKDLVEYAKEKFSGKAIVFSLTTNGTLLIDSIVDFLVKEKFFITLSIDGPKDIHDQNRIFAHSEKGSFDTIYKNLERIKIRHPEFFENLSLSTVLNPQNDFLHINELFKDKYFKKLALNAAIVENDDEEISFTPSYLSEMNYQQFLALLSQVEEDSHHIVAKVAMEEIYTTQSRLKRLKPSVPQLFSVPAGPCLPGKSRLFVDCFGNLFPCERVSDCSQCMKIGSLKDGFNFQNIQQLLNIAQLTPDACKNCWAAPLCGVCAKKADSHGNLSPDKKLNACASSKNYAVFLLQLKILFTEFRVKNRCEE